MFNLVYVTTPKSAIQMEMEFHRGCLVHDEFGALYVDQYIHNKMSYKFLEVGVFHGDCLVNV